MTTIKQIISSTPSTTSSLSRVEALPCADPLPSPPLWAHRQEVREQIRPGHALSHGCRLAKRLPLIVLTCLLSFCFVEVAHAGICLGITWGIGELVSFDPDSGVITTDHDLALLPRPEFTGLTYDPNHNTLYALNQLGPLYSIDPVTLQTTFIGNIGLSSALAYDPVNNSLYTVANGFLSSINVSNGQLTPIGDPHSGIFVSLSYNPNNRLLCGLVVDDFSSPAYVVTIDPSTGAESKLFTTPYHTVMGIAMIPGQNSFISWVNGAQHTYGLTDLDTGTVTLLGGADNVDAEGAIVYQDFFVASLPDSGGYCIICSVISFGFVTFGLKRKI